MKVDWLADAQSDLIEIDSYIARDNPRAAQTILDRIELSASRLESHPRLGRPGRIAGTRELVVHGTPYIIAYRIREQSVEIVAVIHGARKWPDAL